MILVVEGHADSREYLRTVLRRCGHAARVACDGREALAMARAEAPDPFIPDENMPGMSGLELLTDIWSDAALAGARVIFFSAAFGHASATRALDVGAPERLVKGVHGPDHILAAVARALTPPSQPASGRRQAAVAMAASSSSTGIRRCKGA